MKKNSIIIILFLIILGLLIYILVNKNENKENDRELVVNLIDKIELEYLSVYLYSDGQVYLVPISKEKILELKDGNNLKERLRELYNNAEYSDFLKKKIYKLEINGNVEKIRKIELENNIYIIFIKDNHKLSIFNYENYYDLLSLKVEEYDNYKDVLDIVNDEIIYLDNEKEKFLLKE